MPTPIFDVRTAKAMKPGECIVFAPSYPGLRLEATATRRTWTYRYRHPDTGLMKQTKLGSWPAMGVAAAVEAWEAISANRRAGKDVGAVARAAKAEKRASVAAAGAGKGQPKTCTWLAAQYINDVVAKNRKAKGAGEVERMLDRALAAKGSVLARSLSRQDAHDIVASVAATAPRVAAMVRQELRAAWSYGIDRGEVSDNPFLGRTLGGRFKAKKGTRVLSESEVGQLMRWWDTPGSHSRTVRDALELVLRTGLRSGEVCGIRSSELVEKGGVLWSQIPGERMKGGLPHSAPLLGRARAIVVARRDGEFLFPRRDGKGPIEQKVLGVEVYAHSGRSTAASYAQRKVCPVTDWSPHDLRRTARTLLAEMGCPFEVGEAILAHALPGVAGVYNLAVHAVSRVLWLEKLGERLDELSAE